MVMLHSPLLITFSKAQSPHPLLELNGNSVTTQSISLETWGANAPPLLTSTSCVHIGAPSGS